MGVENETGRRHVVDFAKDDPEDPFNWQPWRKWSCVVAISLTAATTELATVIAAPVAPQILKAFHSSNAVDRTLLVSIWQLGEVVGPLLYGPLSELYGRAYVVNTANLLFFCFSLGTALSPNMQTLIACRFLTGASVVAPTLAPAIVGDLFSKEERGTALSTMMLANLIAPAIGPIVGSYLGQNAGWRWAFWLTTILSGVATLFFALTYRESYKVTLLSARASKLRRQTGNPAWRSKYAPVDSLGNQVGARAMFIGTIWRPLNLLVHSFVLFIMAAYVSICIGLFYTLLTIIAPLYQETYHFSEGAAGIAFLGLILGLLVGLLLCRFTLDKLLRSRTGATAGITARPERRLPPLLAAAPLTSAGFVMFGWTADKHVHWMAPIVATGFAGFGYSVVNVTARSYIVDAYGVYGASALAAVLVLQNISAAFLPLAGPPLHAALGLGWGNTLLGLVAVPFWALPVVLIVRGERLRRAQKVAILE